MEGRREIPPTLEALTVSVHVGDDEEIIGMSTIEVEDIEGCVSWYQVELHFVIYPTSRRKAALEINFLYFEHSKFAKIKIRLSLDFCKSFNDIFKWNLKTNQLYLMQRI